MQGAFLDSLSMVLIRRKEWMLTTAEIEDALHVLLSFHVVVKDVSVPKSCSDIDWYYLQAILQPSERKNILGTESSAIQNDIEIRRRILKRLGEALEWQGAQVLFHSL